MSISDIIRTSASPKAVIVPSSTMTSRGVLRIVPIRDLLCADIPHIVRQLVFKKNKSVIQEIPTVNVHATLHVFKTSITRDSLGTYVWNSTHIPRIGDRITFAYDDIYSDKSYLCLAEVTEVMYYLGRYKHSGVNTVSNDGEDLSCYIHAKEIVD